MTVGIIQSVRDPHIKPTPESNPRIDRHHPLGDASLVGCWLMSEGSGDIVADLSETGHIGTISNLIWVPEGLESDGDATDMLEQDKRLFSSYPFTLVVNTVGT